MATAGERWVDDVLAVLVAATSPMSDADVVLDVDGIWSFYSTGPCQGAAGPPGCACTHALPF